MTRAKKTTKRLSSRTTFKLRPKADAAVFYALSLMRGLSAKEISDLTFKLAREDSTFASVSPQTISNWRKGPALGGTRFPQHILLASALKALGYEMEITAAKKKGIKG